MRKEASWLADFDSYKARADVRAFAKCFTLKKGKDAGHVRLVWNGQDAPLPKDMDVPFFISASDQFGDDFPDHMGFIFMMNEGMISDVSTLVNEEYRKGQSPKKIYLGFDAENEAEAIFYAVAALSSET